MVTDLPDQPENIVKSAARLRILQTTDLHAHVLAFDYNNNRLFARRGLSRTAVQIEHARAQAGASLLFDSGDFLQGSPLTDRLAQTPQAAPYDHPVITAMNLLNYDAATLGNHDLDFGLAHLSAALSQANFPVVSANLRLPAEAVPQLKRFVILQRHLEGHDAPLRIGVTGCLPDITLRGAAGFDPSISCDPMIPALTRAICDMKREGAELIVVLAHCGKTAIDAEQIKRHGVDVVLGGHTHEVFPAPEAPHAPLPHSDAPVMISGALGEYLGQMDLSLTRAQNTWQTQAAHIKMIRNPLDAPESQPLVSALAPHHNETLITISKPIGETSHQIDSFFALTANNSALQLVARAFTSALSKDHAESEWAQLPLLSAIAPFRTGGLNGPRYYCHIQTGALRLRDLDKLYSFPDTLCALLLNGKALRAWLEMSASIFRQIPDGSHDHTLHDPEFPSYLFDVIPQLDYEIDVSQPPRFNERREQINFGRGRISALSYQGSPVTDEALFVMAASSFRARGVMPVLPEKDTPHLLFDTGVSCRSAIRSYISKTSPISLAARPSWRFKPQANTSARFLTSQRATSDPDHGINFMRNTDDGFAEMRISLAGRQKTQEPCA